jgi:hypothetical protein
MRGALVLPICLNCAACGAVTALDPAFGLEPDASCDSVDAHGSGDAPSQADVVRLEAGTNGYSDAALPICASQADCNGWATCQEGLCCAGVLVDGGVCLCGGTPGCDLRHGCCVPPGSTTGALECVSDCPGP